MTDPLAEYLEVGGVGGRELWFFNDKAYSAGIDVLFLMYKYFLAVDFTNTFP